MSDKQPKFVPRPGQVDFTHIRWVPVINCVVKYGDKILLVKRSEKMNLYPGVWNGISGFLDDEKNLEEKVHEELSEEIGIESNDIISITVGGIFDQSEPKYKKIWIVHPVLVEVSVDRVTLDWEAQEYRWLTLGEVKKLPLLPGFDTVLRNLNL